MDAANANNPPWIYCGIGLLLVLAGQLGLTAQLFGPDPWSQLHSSEPILSGRHPLHLYHGSLGVGTFRERWTTTCYDPAFQAGYPKTPVFDDGARPAELFLLMSKANYSPAAYKLGLFAVCLLVPLALAVAAWGLGLTPSGILLAAVGGCLVWWSPPVRDLLNAGYLDHLLAGLMALIFLGSLVRYADYPGIHSWLLMSFSVALGWFSHPLLWFGLIPVGALYYLAIAPRHGLSWHLGLLGVACTGLAPNLWWLADWVAFWWIRQPSIDELAQLPHWSTVLGQPQEYTEFLGPGLLGWGLLAGGILGLCHQLRQRKSLAALVVGLAALVTILVVRLGDTWPALQMISVSRVAPFAVALLIIPSAAMIGHWWDSCPAGRWAMLAGALIPILLGWFPQLLGSRDDFLKLDNRPLHIGLNPAQQEWARILREETDASARILVEDIPSDQPGWNWTALLPVLTERTFVGGLDTGCCVDHTFSGMRDRTLNGRLFSDWSEFERDDFLERYNVGWVWCQSAAATDWWATHPGARIIYRQGLIGGVLFEIDRKRDFILSGSGVVERADRQKIVITDAQPDENGELLLSFHHQPGMRVSPTVIKILPDKDLFDPVPFIKLRLPSPVTRIVLSWNNP